jgi:excinuclease ABC subunit B
MPTDRAFELVSDFKPMGDQPGAIAGLVDGLRSNTRHQTLLGATGTGKTFTMANVIAQTRKPTLVISHNKTLAAQLYEEFRELFPHNAVSYFVSYYDYYQPEAYIPARDIYIEKDASRNDDLDRLRLAATSNLLSREDVIIVSSVSCIYGLGSPVDYRDRVLSVALGDTLHRREFLLGLADMQYARTDATFERGQYRVRGDVIEVFPAYEQFAIRIELFGDDVDRIELIHPLTGEVLAEETHAFIFPAVHYVMPQDRLEASMASIRAELDARIAELNQQGNLLAAHRLMARTKYDIEMIEEAGYCSGIENYSVHMDGRQRGERPFTLLDYFRHVPGRDANDWLVFIDESHVTIPQIRAMFNGDRARKQVLVDHGFRLPSAMDNRPLRFEEFEQIVPSVVYVSATPGPYELQQCEGHVVEQIIRPTGLLDPQIEVRPARGQVPDFMAMCKERAARGERVLCTVLTKRLAEDLTTYLHDNELKVRYLHSDIDTLERVAILRDLRTGDFDVLIGVNLLREGLDLPEVSLVAIIDADKQGFLRSETSLIQTMGRAARNVNSLVIMYADTVTPQMEAAIDVTSRRRERQIEFNKANNITPATIVKAIRHGLELELKARQTARSAVSEQQRESEYDRDELMRQLEDEMLEAAQQLEFEKAARLRDQVKELRELPDDAFEGTVSPTKSAKDGRKPGAARSRTGITTRKKRKNHPSP